MAILDSNGFNLGSAGGNKADSFPDLVSQIANRAPTEIAGFSGALAFEGVNAVISTPENLALITKCSLPAIDRASLVAAKSPEAVSKAFGVAGGPLLKALLKGIKAATSIIT